MDKYVKTVTLDNEIEARLVASILSERHIPYQMGSYHDTAYDGLFQTQKGWGYISAPLIYHEQILGIIAELREKARMTD